MKKWEEWESGEGGVKEKGRGLRGNNWKEGRRKVGRNGGKVGGRKRKKGGREERKVSTPSPEPRADEWFPAVAPLLDPETQVVKGQVIFTTTHPTYSSWTRRTKLHWTVHSEINPFTCKEEGWEHRAVSGPLQTWNPAGKMSWGAETLVWGIFLHLALIL